MSEEMTDKPTGVAAAAKELWEPLRKVFVAAKCEIPENMEENIEAIILKHCPEDKAGKLVEALIEARVKLGFPVGTQPAGMLGCLDYKVADTVKIIDSALAEHEKVKK